MSALSAAAAHHATHGGPWPRTAPHPPPWFWGFLRTVLCLLRGATPAVPLSLVSPPKHLKVLGTGR